MNTKFIGINGFEKIRDLETAKNRKFKLKSKRILRKHTPCGLLLTVLYYLVIAPVQGIKEFSFKNLSAKKVLAGFVTPVAALTALVLTVCYWTNYVDFGLAVKCGGETVASVTDTGVIQQAKEITNDRLSDDVDAQFTPVYQVAVMNDSQTSQSPHQVSNAIVSTDHTVADNAAGLYINNKLVGVCDSYQELYEDLDSFLADDRKRYDDKTEVGFYNKVQVKEGIFSKDDIMSAEKLINKAEGKDLLKVLVKTDYVTAETVPYDTKVKYDKSKDSSYCKVIRNGKNGRQKTTYRISYLDGVQIDAVITDVKTTKKPLNRVVVKGKLSGNSVSTVSSAGFIWPVPSVHTVSSGYGYRDGYEFHTGLDIADGNCYGASIVAAKSGTVEWAGYDDSGYGNYVIINHGDGYKTLYGHCSAVYVSQGQKVCQGQSIAAIGSTGQSSGNHCHFEVRTGNRRSDRQNPLNYVSY